MLAVVLALAPQPLALLLRARPEDLGLRRDGLPATDPPTDRGGRPPTDAAPDRGGRPPTDAAPDRGANVATVAAGGRRSSAVEPASAVRAPTPTSSAPDPRVVDPEWVHQEWTVGRAVRTRRFQFLFLTFGLTTFATQQTHAHQAAYLVGSGYDPMLAAMVVGTVGLASIVGKILIGTASDALGRERLFSLGVAAGVAGMLLLLSFGDGQSPPALLFLYATLFAIGYSAAPTLTPAITADLFSGRHYGAIYGVLMLCNGIGGAAGAWFGGYVFDHTGSYRLGLVDRHGGVCPGGARGLASGAAPGAAHPGAGARGHATAGATAVAVQLAIQSVARLPARLPYPLATPAYWGAGERAPSDATDPRSTYVSSPGGLFPPCDGVPSTISIIPVLGCSQGGGTGGDATFADSLYTDKLGDHSLDRGYWRALASVAAPSRTELPHADRGQSAGANPGPARRGRARGDGAPTGAGGDAAALASGAPQPRRLVVREPLGANVRAEPSSAGAIVATLVRGTLVEERMRDGDTEAAARGWWRVAWNGREGWVATSLLQPASGVP